MQPHALSELYMTYLDYQPPAIPPGNNDRPSETKPKTGPALARTPAAKQQPVKKHARSSLPDSGGARQNDT